ncbi:hypothetical protein ACO1MZ_14335, partial [Staphylococcus aureus]
MLLVAERLNKLGFDVIVHPFGCAVDEAKKRALSQVCERVFDNVNEALEYAVFKPMREFL